MAKVAAIVLMFIDHTGAYYFTDETWLRAVGRGAAPIFLYLAGFAASYRFNWEIFILATLLAIANLMLGFPLYQFNILFTILICRAILDWLEKRNKTISRPHEWFIGALALIPATCEVFMYGSLGMMFALSGYFKRKASVYSPRMQRNFMRATFVTFGLWELVAFKFFDIDTMILVIVLCGVYRFLCALEVRATDLSHYPAWLAKFCKFVSYYSARIYVLHLLIIWAITQQHV